MTDTPPSAVTGDVPGDVSGAARRWATFFETLTPDRLDDLSRLCHSDIRFKDPFNDVIGIQGVRRVFEHMFDTVDRPVFTVTDIAVSDRTAYLRWHFSFLPKGRAGEDWTITGVSEVLFDRDLLVVSHLDHWDAGEQFYARLPLVGWLVRFVRSKLSSS